MKHLYIFSVLFLLISCKQESKNHKIYPIEEFYKNTRISGGSFSEDESKLLVSSDETGIFNVYEINIKEASKKQITFSESESFFAVDYLPGSEQIIYSADKGGNEINHLYLLNKDGLSTDLTPDEKAKASFFGWSEDKKYMYYISNKRDSKYFDLYKMDIKDWNSHILYKYKDGLDISKISYNERYFCLSKSITTSQSKLYLYDRDHHKIIEISDDIASYRASGFSRDNKYLYYITDSREEFSYLMEYEISTKKKKLIYKSNWGVMYSYLSKNEKYRVIAVNEDGKNNIVILDNVRGVSVDLPAIKDGDIRNVSISESEKLLRLSVGTSKAPSNVYICHIKDKKLTKLTRSLNKNINSDDLVSAEVIYYKSFDGLEIPAIYYKPKIASKNNRVPALVWVHGGPGGQSRVGYSPLIQYLVNHGYAILAVNNRGSSGYGKTFYKADDKNHGDKDLKDCIWGKRWLQSKEYIHPEKIGIIGGSYGGYMTMAAMAFTPEEFKVGVNIFGVTNWLRTLRSIPPYWESFRKALYEELGDPYTIDSVRLKKISPLFHASNIKNPVMVLQGANDPRVLQIESDEIVEAIKKNNIPVEYIVFPDEGHGFIKKQNEIKGYKAINTFLEKYLK